MNKKLSKAFEKFQKYFHYTPKLPPNVDFDEDEYSDELLKCVEDNFDYTIEKYGTIVKPYIKGEKKAEIIID